MRLFLTQKTNDKERFKQLFNDNYDRLFLFACHLLQDEEQARDVISGIFCYVWENIGRLTQQTALAYMQNMVKTRCIDILRHKAIEREYQENYLHEVQRAYEDNAENLAIDAKVEQMLDSLPPYTRTILDKCYLQRKKYREVAEELHIHQDTVKRHIMRALKFLRENREKFADDV